MDTSFIVFACIGFVAILLGLLQIIWIRSQISKYSSIKQESDFKGLRDQQAVLKNNMFTNMKMYQLLVNVGLTNLLNRSDTTAYKMYTNVVHPQTFNVPLVCSNASIYSSNISYDYGYSLALDSSMESCKELYNDLKYNGISYIMIDQSLFLVKIHEMELKALQLEVKEFDGVYVIDISPMTSGNMMIFDVAEACVVQMYPFIGKAADDSSIKQIADKMSRSVNQSEIFGVLGISKNIVN